MDNITSFRLAYLGAAPHSFYVAFTWLAGGIIGDFYSVTYSVIFFLLAGFLNFPVGEVLRKYVFKTAYPLEEGNNLPMLFKLLTFTIPLSLPLIYFACQANINYFYPAFAMVIGAHYLPFYYGYRLPAFLVGGVLIWAVACLGGFYFPENFTLTAYATGFVIAGMAVVNYLTVKKEMNSLAAVNGELNQVK